MKYKKPSMVVLAAATHPIQTYDGRKDSMSFDVLVPTQHVATATPLMRADE